MKPETTRKQLVLPCEATKAFTALAKQRGMNDSQIYREALGAFLAQHGYHIDMTIRVGNPDLLPARNGDRRPDAASE